MEQELVKARFAQPGNEAAVLACILKDPVCYFDVETKLSDQDFLSPHNRALWTVIKSLMREGVASLDTTAILTQAGALKIEEQMGGYDYVNALSEKIIDPSNLRFYLEKVVDGSTKYRIRLALSELEDLTEKNHTLTGETLDAETLLGHAQDTFLKISIESNRGEEARNLSEGLSELIQEASSSPSSVKGLPTGFSRLDELINGLEPGTLTVLGARPKTGKSALLLNVAKHIAFERQVPTLILDTEMSTREQQFRLLSLLSGVPERQIKNGTFVERSDWAQAVEDAKNIISSGLVLHKYYPDFTPEGVAALLRKYQYQYGVGCLIFDYIKLPDADLQQIGNVKEHQALGYLCVALKNLAGQLDLPILTAAQIGRTGANKGRASASDFADSDRILRYANTLLALSYKTKDELEKLQEDYGKDDALKMGTHRLQILETRGGGTHQTGIDIVFRKDIIRMTEASVQLYEKISSNEEDDNGR